MAAENNRDDGLERLQKILAARGIASRRNAEEIIKAGRVTVNGKVVTELGSRADPVKDTIIVDGKTLPRQRFRYILLNKPSGYLTTMKDERDRLTVMHLVNVPERVVPVGRLDRETDGLLILTNDGDLANRVMHPRYQMTKEYQVLTDKLPPHAAMQQIRAGVRVDDRLVTPSEFRILREAKDGVWLTIEVHEGLNHLIRKMMEAAGIEILKLKRVRIGPLSLAGIPKGAWRDMTDGEVAALKEGTRKEKSPPSG